MSRVPKVLCLITSLILVCLVSSCMAAEPLQKKESVLFYTDGLWDAGIKDLKTVAKDSLKVKKIKWKAKKSKAGSYMILAENVEKELLKANPDRVILAIGICDLWNKKSKESSELDLEKWKSAIESVVDDLQSAGKSIVLCTPYPLFEGTNAALSERIAAAVEIIRSIAVDKNVDCCDVYKPFMKIIAQIQPGKKGKIRNKGATTKNGIKLNAVGNAILTRALGAALCLSGGSTLSRDLRKGDVVGFASPYRLQAPMGALSQVIKEHYKDSMGVVSPRGYDVRMENDFFNRTPQQLIEVYKKSRPTIMIVSPGQGILGSRDNAGVLEDGSYEKKLKALLKAIRSDMDVELFVCTPLIWCEVESQKITVGGANFKACQKWADQTRSVAEAVGVPIIDIHQRCLDSIEKYGSGKVIFAGTTKNGSWYPMTYQNTEMVKKALAAALNFNYGRY